MAISSTDPDWSREQYPRFSWMPSRALLRAIRSYQQAPAGMRGALTRLLAIYRHRFWSIVTGADIPLNARLGGGLLMPHPNGIVFHPDIQIGPNCLVFQQVTLGANGRGVPRIGGHVDIGAGAKILGRVTVGDHARIGANAVVLQDVPAGATAVGNPARIIPAPHKGSPSAG
ncbi:MAG TPA: serine acetyltransferase [Sphingobium sp.]|nr:serine acetyltransferase [Sphingobium sp.]